MDNYQAWDLTIQTDRLEELHEWDQDALVWDEHPEQHEGEQQIGAAELPLGEHIAVHTAKQRRNYHSGYSEDYAVSKALADHVKRTRKVAEGQTSRGRPDAARSHILRGLERRHNRYIDRHEEEDREDDK